MLYDICQTINFRTIAELRPKYGRVIDELCLGGEYSSREESSEDGSVEDSMVEKAPHAPPLLRGFYFHHPTCKALELSYRRGCQFCTMLWHGIMQPRGSGPKLPGTPWAWGTASPLLLAADLTKNELWEPYPGQRLQLYCGSQATPLFVGPTDLPNELARFSNNLSHIDLLKDIEDSHTGSPSSLKLSSVWLDICIAKHPYCSRFAKSTPKLPTRVLDVGPPDGSEDPYLYITSGQVARYIALSHCWGRSPMLTTEIDTISERQQKIPLSQMPQSFRDAVITTRAFAIRYLWIDALCIIQNSVKDWEKESSQMGDIYRGSTFTIAAVGANDGGGGCFALRNPMVNRPCPLNIEFPGAANMREKRVFAYLHDYLRLTGPLYDRAWVLQEQVLSTRTLAYSSNTLYWSCATMIASESLPIGTLNATHSNISGFGHKAMCEYRTSISTSLKRQPAECIDLYDAWYELVAEYSRRDLSVQTDRLPALSGLASEMNKILDDVYIAGLWRRDIQRGMLWSCQFRSHRTHRPPTSVAPSWSWASVIGNYYGIIFNKPSPTQVSTEAYSIDILSVECAPAGFNPFGEVRRGVLTVKGFVKAAINRLNSAEPGRRRIDDNLLYDVRTQQALGTVDWDEEEDKHHLTVKTVWCLSVYLAPAKYDDEESRQKVCLVLVPTGLQENEFRRVGLAHVTYTQHTDWFREVEKSTLTII